MSYKFSQNKACEFYPCHQVTNKEGFNCLFCYCPLFLLKKDCGGNFKYTYGVKDCSECLIPHSDNGYEYIMSKIGEVIDLSRD